MSNYLYNFILASSRLMTKVAFRLHQEGCRKWLQGANSASSLSSSIKKAILNSVSVTGNRVTFDAENFSKLVFPTPQNMIFISHAHREKKVACEIAKVIESTISATKPVRCFIDSEYWESVYRTIDNLKTQHALKPGHDDLYLCMQCNEISKNLFMILSMALQKAIRDSLMFIFVPPADQDAPVADMDTLTTSSPWIAQELLTSSLIPEWQEMTKIAESVQATEEPSIEFKYAAPWKHLHKGTVNDAISSLKNACINHYERKN